MNLLLNQAIPLSTIIPGVYVNEWVWCVGGVGEMCEDVLVECVCVCVNECVRWVWCECVLVEWVRCVRVYWWSG